MRISSVGAKRTHPRTRRRRHGEGLRCLPVFFLFVALQQLPPWLRLGARLRLVSSFLYRRIPLLPLLTMTKGHLNARHIRALHPIFCGEAQAAPHLCQCGATAGGGRAKHAQCSEAREVRRC